MYSQEIYDDKFFERNVPKEIRESLKLLVSKYGAHVKLGTPDLDVRMHSVDLEAPNGSKIRIVRGKHYSGNGTISNE